MVPNELLHADVARVRCLCNLSPDAAREICAGARATDPMELHCARFALHFVHGTPLPAGYAWEVLHAPEYAKGADMYLAPYEAHVRLLALFATDLEAAKADLAEFCSRWNSDLMRAAAFCFARYRRVLSDERLVELSYSEDDAVRMCVALLLRHHASPCRGEILARLIVDPRFSVSLFAGSSAAFSGDPALVDLAAAHEHFLSLSFAGDPRARPCIESWVASDDPLDGEWAVAAAGALGDRALMAQLWRHRVWDTRSNAIVGSAATGLLQVLELDELLVGESAEHLAELALQWSLACPEGLEKIAMLLCAPTGPLPERGALAAGEPAALIRVRGLVPDDPTLCGAAIRFVDEEAAARLVDELATSVHPEARSLAARLVSRRELRPCFARVAELCTDAESSVAHAAADATCRGHWRYMPCALFGLDTAALRARDDFSAGWPARRKTRELVEALLWARDTEQAKSAD